MVWNGMAFLGMEKHFKNLSYQAATPAISQIIILFSIFGSNAAPSKITGKSKDRRKLRDPLVAQFTEITGPTLIQRFKVTQAASITLDLMSVDNIKTRVKSNFHS